MVYHLFIIKVVRSMCSDEKLIDSAKQGDDDALSVLAEKYMAIAEDKATKYSSSGLEVDDLVQEAMLGLLSAIFTYNEQGNASFHTYANVCMENRIFSALNKTKQKKQVPRYALVELDKLENVSSSSNCEPENLFFLKQQADEILKAASSELSESERTVFGLYLKGHSYEEISKLTDCTPKAVDGAMQRVRKKLRKYL